MTTPGFEQDPGHDRHRRSPRRSSIAIPWSARAGKDQDPPVRQGWRGRGRTPRSCRSTAGAPDGRAQRARSRTWPSSAPATRCSGPKPTRRRWTWLSMTSGLEGQVLGVTRRTMILPGARHAKAKLSGGQHAVPVLLLHARRRSGAGWPRSMARSSASECNRPSPRSPNPVKTWLGTPPEPKQSLGLVAVARSAAVASPAARADSCRPTEAKAGRGQRTCAAMAVGRPPGSLPRPWPRRHRSAALAMHCVAYAPGSDEAMWLAADTSPDVVVIGVPEGDEGIDTTKSLCAEHPGLRVLVLTGRPPTPSARRARSRGGRGRPGCRPVVHARRRL